MSDQLVTIERYKFQPQAETARIALDQAGILAFLQGLFGSNTGLSTGITSGWIELQVEPARVSEARAVLESTPGLLWEDKPDYGNLDDNKCLSCGQIMPPKAKRCPACGWSFLDQSVEKVEPVDEDEI
jgi:hypothetical protein